MTMPKEFYKTGRYSVDHSTFGGTICLSDFYTEFSGKQNTKGSTIAAKIISNWRFDESCNKNDKKRIHNNNWRKENGNKK